VWETGALVWAGLWQDAFRQHSLPQLLFSSALEWEQCCEQSLAPRGGDCSSPRREEHEGCARNKIDTPIGRSRINETQEDGEEDLWGMNSSQDVVQSGFREGQVLINGIEIVGVDAGDELVDNPVSLGVREALSLIFHHLSLLIFIIINLRAEGSNLLNLFKRAKSKRKG
jgi:hypothetical protein